jgi:Flp pilus assembly protein TadB
MAVRVLLVVSVLVAMALMLAMMLASTGRGRRDGQRERRVRYRHGGSQHSEARLHHLLVSQPNG